PKEFIKALNQNKKAKEFFEQLTPNYQKQFIGWIRVAKRQATIDERISESVQLLENGEKLGLR
ncbi:MAG: YdeI/OmpD-associated family protein, partial [Fidelibacterota bacterium]